MRSGTAGHVISVEGGRGERGNRGRRETEGKTKGQQGETTNNTIHNAI